MRHKAIEGLRAEKEKEGHMGGRGPEKYRRL
jgi:hypothetical protein